MARLAAIDIGSNAIRLRIVDVDPPEWTGEEPRFPPFRDVHVDREAVRLGHDVFTKGYIETTVLGNACEALRRFRQSMDAAKVERYRAVATSAAREAKNADVFVERSEREARLHVEVIEGVEEARLVQLAVTERMDLRDRAALLIDVGGGSTELTLLRGKSPVFSRSVPVGTVRLIEAFLDAGRVTESSRRLLDEYVARVCGEAVREVRDMMGSEGARGLLLVGTGGNIETLADLCPAPPVAEAPRGIDVVKMRRVLSELSAQTVDERRAAFNLRPDRADTIVPAATVLTWIADALCANLIAAPGVGLREGVLVDVARRHFLHGRELDAAPILDACLRLGRHYRFDEEHGRAVARFAVKIFDALSARHNLTPRDRVLLQSAALLHDVGDFVRYEGHHKHSYYLISHGDIMGLEPVEREIVANLARYHRKGPPQLDHENFRSLSREDRGRVKALAAILRIADALDSEHEQRVTDIGVRVDGSALVLALSGARPRDLEEWTVAFKASLLRDVFGLSCRLEAAGL